MVHPAPWTALYVTDERQFHLLDLHGISIGTIGDEDVARTIVRLVNASPRPDDAVLQLAAVIPMTPRRTTEAPPAPNPLKGAATTWDELFDHLIFLLETGETGVLRNRLFEYARVTVRLQLPNVFVASDDSPGDNHV